ncbi:hypothetical protein TELCIR_07721 [Teladorsagia circumcincta]|uniref:Uncharacterized protein n=1 Tax=Teladorsagia circumcincta TaxID=45464 RepID=A0A2G9UJU0_TELCI|nr:hypothetical protein TELCIR_07721 [Teladorsagia circumcincta]
MRRMPRKLVPTWMQALRKIRIVKIKEMPRRILITMIMKQAVPLEDGSNEGIFR